MLSEDKYFRDLTEAELWQRYCGFLDLSIDEFMDIQQELLMDEIDRVADSILGKKIMGEHKPKSVEEFRRIVPLTTYDDYEPYLTERQEDALAIKPHMWCHSAGRGGQFKWIPYSSEFLEKVVRAYLSGFILASAGRKGQINISPGFRILAVVPPPPYASGYIFQFFAEHFSVRPLPDPAKTQNMDLADKLRKGFQVALKDGVDVIAALASILVKMGEQFGGQARGMKFSPFMLHPKTMSCLLQAWLRSKRAKRPMMPKDLWPAKAIMTGGVDTAIYKDDITHYWGSEPYEYYVCAEAFVLAIQGWNKKGMTFLHDIAFMEFIPYDELREHEDDKGYQPPTVLLNEVEEGRLYEVVITQLYGLPLLRYRMKDLVKVVALQDNQMGVNLPQVVFQRRVDEVINLGGLAQLDEKTIWRAITNTGLRYTDWAACKEYHANQTCLRLYLELKEERQPAEVETMIDDQLKIVDTDYRDIKTYLELQPVRVTILSPGTFERYMDEKRKEGADLAHLKPNHVNAPDTVIERLLRLSEVHT